MKASDVEQLMRDLEEVVRRAVVVRLQCERLGLMKPASSFFEGIPNFQATLDELVALCRDRPNGDVDNAAINELYRQFSEFALPATEQLWVEESSNPVAMAYHNVAKSVHNLTMQISSALAADDESGPHP